MKNAPGTAARAEAGSKTAKQLRVAGLFWKMRFKSMLLKKMPSELGRIARARESVSDAATLPFFRVAARGLL